MKAARTRAANKRKHPAKAKPAAKAKTASAAHHHAAAAPAPAAKRTAAQIKAAHKRALSLDGVSCCSAEALAASLRLTGRAVSDSDVLALYRHTADSPDAAASIWATLEAAYRWGLGGVRPVSFGPVGYDDPAAQILGVELRSGPHAVCADGGQWFSWGDPWPLSAFGGAVVEEAWGVVWP